MKNVLALKIAVSIMILLEGWKLAFNPYLQELVADWLVEKITYLVLPMGYLPVIGILSLWPLFWLTVAIGVVTAVWVRANTIEKVFVLTLFFAPPILIPVIGAVVSSGLAFGFASGTIAVAILNRLESNVAKSGGLILFATIYVIVALLPPTTSTTSFWGGLAVFVLFVFSWLLFLRLRPTEKTW